MEIEFSHLSPSIHKLYSKSAMGLFSDLDFSHSGRLLAASCTSNVVYVFNPNRGLLVRLFNKPHNDSVSNVHFVNDHRVWTILKPS